MADVSRDDCDFREMIVDTQSQRCNLLKIGVREVRRWDWGETDHTDIDDYAQAFTYRTCARRIAA